MSFTIGGGSSSTAEANTVVIDGVTYTVESGANMNSGIDSAFNDDTVPASGDPDFDATLDNIFSGNSTVPPSGDTDFDSGLDNIFNP